MYDNKCQNIPAQECKAGDQSRKHLIFFIIVLYYIIAHAVLYIDPLIRQSTKTNADMISSAAPAIPRNVLRLDCFIKAIRRLHFIFRFHKKTVKLFTTKNAIKSLRRIVTPPTLRNASRLQNKTVRLSMIKSVKKYPRRTAKRKRYH